MAGGGQRPSDQRKRRNVLIAIALVAGFALGLGLVLLGGDDSGDSASNTTRPSTEEDPPPVTARPLPLEDVSQAAVAELTGLAFPPEAESFLTASAERGTQLDITFTMPAAAEAAFLSESGLDAPEDGARQVLHSSPLWKVNPEGDVTIRGTADSTERVNRAVELVEEGDGIVRARIVITSASS